MTGDLRAAIGLLTRLPVGTAPLGPAGLSRAAGWFPVVGLVVGGCAAAVHGLAVEAGLASAPATVLALVTAVIVTGGLHEDALADVADGLGVHGDRARRLEVMRDPRVGTFGALAIAVMVVLPVVTLERLSSEAFAQAVVCAHVLARWSILGQTRLPLGDGGTSAALVRPGWPTFAAGTLAALIAVVLVAGPEHAAVAAATAIGVTLAGAVLAMRAVGGVTGDTLGAVTKLVELSVYVALGARLA